MENKKNCPLQNCSYSLDRSINVTEKYQPEEAAKNKYIEYA